MHKQSIQHSAYQYFNKVLYCVEMSLWLSLMIRLGPLWHKEMLIIVINTPNYDFSLQASFQRNI